MKAKKSVTRRSSKARHKTRQLEFQPLEKREMMDAKAILATDGVLTINAGNAGADVDVFEIWGRVVVASQNNSAATRNVSFSRSDVKQIVFNGSPYSDTFTNYTGIADRIFGALGDDVLNGGQGASYIRGGEGNDTIHGGNGNDILHGDAGNDTVYGESGRDTVFGETGHDRLFGGDDADRIFGSYGNDTINGGNGDDYVQAGYGSDTVFGGAGDDYLDGQAGADIIYGDDMFGVQGNDLLHGGTGDDRLYGGGGDDTLHGHSGKDQLYGGNGDDRLYGWADDDQIFGNGGVDYLVGGDGADFLDWGAMRDTLADRSSEDSIPETLRAQLRIDNLYCVEASDGALFSSANDVYFMVSGKQSVLDFGPVRVDPIRGDSWELDTGESVRNISLWQHELKPGESIDLFVSMFDQDDSLGLAALKFAKGLVGLLPTATPSVLSGDWSAALAGLGKSVGKFIDTARLPSDDLLGVFFVHVENVSGRIETRWLAAQGAITNGKSSSAAGDTANFRTWSSDGEFKIQASVLET